jgi:hypothetical protein
MRGKLPEDHCFDEFNMGVAPYPDDITLYEKDN